MKNDKLRKKMQRKKEVGLTEKDFVSTGSTMLNLALTDNPLRGFAKGHYYLVVGTSSSGKTWLSLTCLAEAARNKNFDKHRFILDDVEGGALMNMKKFFGKGMSSRLERFHSRKIENFYDRLDRLFNEGKPFIYILDSMDALTSDVEIKTFLKQRKARTEEKESSGSYGDGKAKVNSQCLRQTLNPLKETGSILIIINQTRDKLTGFGGKTRSGGNALQFYACEEIWSDIKSDIVKTYRGKEREQGTLCKLRTKKNRVSGKKRRTVYVPIYHSYGMDDVGSCIDYLLAEKHWKKEKSGNIKAAKDFFFEGKRNDLIDYICDNELEDKLIGIVGSVWAEIEEAVTIKRKPRYE